MSNGTFLRRQLDRDPPAIALAPVFATALTVLAWRAFPARTRRA